MSELARLKKKALTNPAVKREYEALEDEFAVIEMLLAMRAAAGLTQSELAVRLGTQKSNISRLENGRSNPSWATLQKYAGACGFHLQLDATPLARQ